METSVADQIYERFFEQLEASRSGGPELAATLRRMNDAARLQRDNAVLEALEEPATAGTEGLLASRTSACAGIGQGVAAPATDRGQEGLEWQTKGS